MRFASTAEVAQLPRLVPLSLASVRRGTRIRSACGYPEMCPINSVLTDKPRKPFTFTTAVVLAGSSWKISQPMNGKVFPEWLESSSRRTAMAGRDGAFRLPPPLLSHFGCRHRGCDSDSFAWNKPFRFPGGGGGERARNKDAERRSTEAAAAASQQDDRAPFQRHNNGHRWGNTPEFLQLLCPLYAVEWMRLFFSPAPICHQLIT